MNAFDAALKDGRADNLASELVELFKSCNTNKAGACLIPATFLRVMVAV